MPSVLAILSCPIPTPAKSRVRCSASALNLSPSVLARAILRVHPLAQDAALKPGRIPRASEVLVTLY